MSVSYSFTKAIVTLPQLRVAERDDRIIHQQAVKCNVVVDSRIKVSECVVR